MKLTWSPRALADLHSIVDWLLPRSRVGAAAVLARIEFKASLLQTHPRIGRKLRARPAVRIVPIGKYPYVIYYEERQEEVIILHVRHSSRKFPTRSELA